MLFWKIEMNVNRSNRNGRKMQDGVTDEIVSVLVEFEQEREVWPFNELFEIVFVRLKEKNTASGGEEMLKLRVYEKLQILGSLGAVKKQGRDYTMLPKIKDFLPRQLLFDDDDD